MNVKMIPLFCVYSLKVKRLVLFSPTAIRRVYNDGADESLSEESGRSTKRSLRSRVDESVASTCRKPRRRYSAIRG